MEKELGVVFSLSSSFRVDILDVFMLSSVPLYKAILSILEDAVNLVNSFNSLWTLQTETLALLPSPPPTSEPFAEDPLEHPQ